MGVMISPRPVDLPRLCQSLHGRGESRLGQVGALAAREVSGFARNSREWQQLVEVCQVVDTSSSG